MKSNVPLVYWIRNWLSFLSNFAIVNFITKKNSIMNKQILSVLLAICTFTMNVQSGFAHSKTIINSYKEENISIKIKNDTDEAFTVINAGSGGTYRLSKNTVVTIKMDEGDKLFVYESGKKGKLLLVASPDMDSKVQLVSKL